MNLPSVEEVRNALADTQGHGLSETTVPKFLNILMDELPNLLALRGQATGMVDGLFNGLVNRSMLSSENPYLKLLALARTLEAANAVIAARTEAAVRERCLTAVDDAGGDNCEYHKDAIDAALAAQVKP